MQVHRYDRNTYFKCKVEHCEKSFRPFNAFQQHLNRNHNLRQVDETRNKNFELLKQGRFIKCCSLQFMTAELYSVHLFRHHNFNVVNSNNSLSTSSAMGIREDVNDILQILYMHKLMFTLSKKFPKTTPR